MFDVRFFYNLTPESCYWAGFICADGHIKKGRNLLHIKLANKDFDHLIKFKQIIKFEGEIISKEQYCKIDICGKWYVEDLYNNFLITKQKTFTVSLPNLSEELMAHFIRGYFDGDGIISYSSCPVITFTSGSQIILHQIMNIFTNKLKIKLKSKNKQPPIANGKQISYSGKNAEKIMDWLYKNSTYNIRMDRKYNRYIQYFKEIK